MLDATSWYRERNAEVADRFIAGVQRTLTLIEQFPSSGGPVPGVREPGIRRMPIHNFPYHIVFVEFATRISVLAVAHDRRKPAYWRG